MGGLTDSKSKTMPDRGLRSLLEKQVKYQKWLEVEAALAKAQATLGVIPPAAAKEIAAKAHTDHLDFQLMDEIYQKVGHGFVPFLKVFVKACGPESGKYIHYGATTQNIQQTAQNLIGKQFNQEIMGLTKEILHNLCALALEHADTVMAGRTHGKHAIPITYGYKVAVWISEIMLSLERLQELEKRVFTTMMGGAVGAFNSTGEVGIAVQQEVAEILGLPAMLVPSRNINSLKIEYINALALLANNFHKIAEEVFQTSIEEFGEVSEAFASGTIGSSTMPHKINPKLAKGIIANAQKLYSLVGAGFSSAARPFEADSTANMLFDGLQTEAMELMIEIILRAEELTRTMVVNSERMLENAYLNHGIDNSEYIMMKLAEKIGKDQAHELVYALAIDSELSGDSYLEILMADPLVQANFQAAEVAAMLKPENYVGLSSQIARDVVATCQEQLKELEEVVHV